MQKQYCQSLCLKLPIEKLMHFFCSQINAYSLEYKQTTQESLFQFDRIQ
jgi:hypothetical protein